MKKYITLMLLALVFQSVVAKESKKNPIFLSSLNTTVNNNYLDLDLVLDLTECALKKGNSIYLFPVLATDNDTLKLPKIILNSKSAHQSYKRYPNHHNYANAQVIRELKKKDSSIEYNVSIPAKKWMNRANLLIYKADCSCGNIKEQRLELAEKVTSLSKEKIAKKERKAKRFTIQSADSLDLNLTEFSPIEEDKERFEQGEAYINFEQGKSVILYDYKNNGPKLNQVNGFFNRVVRDQDIEIRGIKIIGYCSIEGTYRHNLDLSQKRSKAFTDWLRARYPELNPVLFDVEWKGEDWTKLTQLIEKSDYYWKYGALDVIYRFGIFDGREKELMKLHSGAPYQQMYKEFFPLLRRVYYRIDYTVRPFEIDESLDLIDDNPQKLSVFEMYEVAKSYGKNSDKYYETIDKAADTYPTDLIANNNAAAYAMSRGEYNRALALLTQAPASAEKYNNLGVLFTLQDDWEQAVFWFNKAIEEGSEEAKTNIETIQFRIKNKAKKEIQEFGHMRIPF